jgi:hypothetical protein
MAQADVGAGEEILDAIFKLSREEVVTRVQAGKLGNSALSAHDYVYDIFQGARENAERKAGGTSV